MTVRNGGKRYFVPVIALYGANAAGKSNMINALSFLYQAVTASYSNWRGKKTLPVTPCLTNSELADNPSEYDCDVLIGGIRFHYGFSVARKGIAREWLHSYPLGLKKVMFERDFSQPDDKQIYIGSSVPKLNPSQLELAKDNSMLFLSANGAVSHETFTPIYTFFKESLVIISASDVRQEKAIAEELADPNVKKLVESFLEKADFGIVGLSLTAEKVDERALQFLKKMQSLIGEMVDEAVVFPIEQETMRVSFVHKRPDGTTFEIGSARESTGTRHLLSLLAPILSALKSGKTVVIDEITTTLHTKLSEELIRLFATPETNANNAQFIFSTHDTNLLSCSALRRDEIWFAEKTPHGQTSIYPLSDFQTRKSDNLERGYLQGRFGAIPFFGDFANLLKTSTNDHT
ncbi:MAG: ATP-binding protein, partial [Burkholderiaceae bacterium]|nr:ATP-binding protein [Burkholderiaceae bacterium]